MISFRCPEHGPIDCVLVDGYPDVPGWQRDPVTGLWGRA